MKKILFTLILMMSLATLSFAGNGKTKAFKGQVIDSNGSPIVGAKVMVKGTEKPVYTDFDGEFVLSKAPDNTFEVSVSMVSFEENTSTITLQSSSKEDFSITLESK